MKKISIKDLSRSEWLELRRQGIGGSDAGVIAKVNPFKSTLDLYNEKTGIMPLSDEESEALRVGRDLEEYVARRFCEATGKKVYKSNYMYRSEEKPFMFADVDRLIVGEDAGLECKTVNAFGKSKWEDGNIPLSYVFQCYHYMFVTGKRTWYLAALIMGVGFTWRIIEWNDEIVNSLVNAEENFWNENVCKRIQPEPDGSIQYSDSLSTLYPSANSSSVLELNDFENKLEERERIIASIESLDEEKQKIEQEIKLVMQESPRAQCGKFSISWGNVETNRFDTKSFRTADPEAYEKYLIKSTSRRFQIKAA